MKKISFILIAGVFLLAGCSADKTAEPIQSLEKATASAEREIQFEATKQSFDTENPPAETGSAVSAVPESDSFWDVTGQQDSNQDVEVPAWDSAAGGDIFSQTQSVPETYTLQYGETAKCIARRFNVDWVTLYSINGISFENERSLPAGTTLNIPKDILWNTAHGPRTSAAHPATYTVQQGDTFNSIACTFGDVFPEAIAQANNLNFNEAILPGLNLQIP